MKTIEAKVVVLGAQGVGKTSIVSRHVSHTFNQLVSPTIGASFFTCQMTIDSTRIKMQIWDTAGQERFRSMAPMYYRKSSAALLIFDLTQYDTFLTMKTWVEELHETVNEQLVMCVLGNKSDLKNSRIVTHEEASEYADSIEAMYFETSAKLDKGIEESFIHLALGLLKLSETGIKNNMKTYSTDTLDHSGYYLDQDQDPYATDLSITSNVQRTPKKSCC